MTRIFVKAQQILGAGPTPKPTQTKPGCRRLVGDQMPDKSRPVSSDQIQRRGSEFLKQQTHSFGRRAAIEDQKNLDLMTL